MAVEDVDTLTVRIAGLRLDISSTPSPDGGRDFSLCGFGADPLGPIAVHPEPVSLLLLADALTGNLPEIWMRLDMLRGANFRIASTAS